MFTARAVSALCADQVEPQALRYNTTQFGLLAAGELVADNCDGEFVAARGGAGFRASEDHQVSLPLARGDEAG